MATLETEKSDAHKRDLETDQKLQALREMEVEIVELRRTNKDLQYQKRELNVKLDAAEEDIEYLQSRTDVCLSTSMIFQFIAQKLLLVDYTFYLFFSL